MKGTLLKKSVIIFGILFFCMRFFLEAQLSVIPEDNILDDYCCVYFYPHVLNQNDRLQDGPNQYGNSIRIKGNTLLVWVDLEPNMRFVHDTKYILISQKDIRIVKGEWWPVLNGKRILYGEREKYTILTPFSSAWSRSDNINIYIYPHELYPFDQLFDGYGQRISIPDNTLLIWVDMFPGAKFTHPTAYILIGKEFIVVEKGGWWPLLNNRQILYGELNKHGVISPFILRCQHIDKE